MTAETYPELDFLMAQTIWIDILACVSMDRVPRIPYREWLEASDVEMADLMGCYNWIMVCIGDLAHLQAWKTEMEEQGTLSMMELATKSRVIQGTLQDGAHRLGLEIKVSTGAGSHDSHLLFGRRDIDLCILLVRQAPPLFRLTGSRKSSPSRRWYC